MNTFTSIIISYLLLSSSQIGASARTGLIQALEDDFYRDRFVGAILDSVRSHAIKGAIHIPTDVSQSIQVALIRDASRTFYGMLSDREKEQFKKRLAEVEHDFVEYDSGMKDLSFGDEDEIIMEFGFNFDSLEITSALLMDGTFKNPEKAYFSYTIWEMTAGIWTHGMNGLSPVGLKMHVREHSRIPEKLRGYFRHIAYPTAVEELQIRKW